MSSHVSPETRATGEAVARLPRTFLSRGDLSAYGLLEQSGYFDRHAEVTSHLLLEVLSGDSLLVDDWLAFSENKRTSSGWYFREEPAGFTVGFVSDAGRTVDQHSYTDRVEACAEFIKKEVEHMRQLG
jgi:spore coat polysaccharide biosynthesis protein SpsF (cytidylyltransferase family)